MVVGPDEISISCPRLISHAVVRLDPGGVVSRHRVQVARPTMQWPGGYGQEADRMGRRQFSKATEVTVWREKRQGLLGVQTSKGSYQYKTACYRGSGFTPAICEMVDVKTPIVIHPAAGLCDRANEPWLDTIPGFLALTCLCPAVFLVWIGYGVLHWSYEIPFTRSISDFVERPYSHITDMFPFLGLCEVLTTIGRGWPDLTPDFAPIMGKPNLEGFL